MEQKSIHFNVGYSNKIDIYLNDLDKEKNIYPEITNSVLEKIILDRFSKIIVTN